MNPPEPSPPCRRTTVEPDTDRRAERWRRWIEESSWPLTAIFVVSFAESTVVPLLIELVVVPFMLARPRQIWLIATVTLAGCLAAAVVGYAIGRFFFASVGEPLLAALGNGEALRAFEETFAEHGFLAIVLVGITPVPFQIAMLGAGAADYPFLLFLLASLLARAIRYYALALVVWLLGEHLLALCRSLAARRPRWPRRWPTRPGLRRDGHS